MKFLVTDRLLKLLRRLYLISDGASTNEIAAILDKKGLIKYKYAFIIHVGLSQYKGMLKPGNYELSPSMTMDQMLAVMAGSGTAETSTE